MSAVGRGWQQCECSSGLSCKVLQEKGEHAVSDVGGGVSTGPFFFSPL